MKSVNTLTDDRPNYEDYSEGGRSYLIDPYESVQLPSYTESNSFHLHINKCDGYSNPAVNEKIAYRVY
jgi:hypothetical protein